MSVAPSSSRLESLAIWHAAVFVVLCTWAFGGNHFGFRPALACWGAFAVPLAGLGLLSRRTERSSRPFLIWLTPALLLIAFVLASTFNPNLKLIPLFDGEVYRPVTPIFGLPSAARPDLAWRGGLFFACLYLTGFNLALLVRRRRALRRLLWIMAINAIILAVFGTLQRLLGLGLYFGAVKPPNPAFFATFIYHNHWGAFIIVMVGVCCALVAHLARSDGTRDLWHSPIPSLILGILLLAATPPLSSSRSTSLLTLFFVSAAAIHGGWLLATRRRAEGREWKTPLLATTLALAVGFGAILFLAWPTIKQRAEKTAEQLRQMQDQGGLGQRAQLYRDTLKMAEAHPWAGWGLESYETVFRRYNSYYRNPLDGLPIYYDEAHSDWLQSWAEIGLIGTGLLLSMALIPLAMTGPKLRRDPVARYLLFGGALVALYAWVEFPLSNPAVVLCLWITWFAGIRHASLGSASP